MNWIELNQKPIDAIVTWAQGQPWAKAMASCGQDAQWHSEGDVWTHTKLVCQQLPRLDAWPELDERERAILIFTALLHDVAKPMTTQVDSETGRVSSPKHAVKGEHVARSVLRDLHCDLSTREQITRMVRFHGRPVFLSEREHPANEVVRMSLLLQNRLLYLFAVADALGRDTDSADRPVEELRYWELLSQEHNCLTKPYEFDTDHARFVFCQRQDADLLYKPFHSKKCDVTMMAGLPGTGKDTWITHNLGENFPVVSLDAIRQELKVLPADDQGQVVQMAQEKCRQYLRKETSFAFNATNILRQTRKRWIRLFNDYNARVEIVYVEPAFKRILVQNKQRPDPVPERIIKKLATKIEPPTLTEAHGVTFSDNASQ